LPDPATGQVVYTMRIGRWPWSRRSVTPLNSLYFPDNEFPPAGQKGACTHLVFAGDSYVFGDGVDRDSNFVEIVRRRSAEQPNAPCLRIFNIGERGTTIDRQRQRIFQTLDRLQPDIIILGQYQNDLTDLTNPGAILNPGKTPGGRSAGDSIRVNIGLLNANFIKMLTYQTFALMIKNGIERDALRHWSVMADSSRHDESLRLQNVYASLFGDLIAKLAARGVATGVVIFPSKFDVLARRSPEESFFVPLAERNHVPHLRLFPLLDERRSPYTFLMYDGHLNEHGNRLVAGAVYDWLFTADTIPFPRLRR
jgi:hypothetical protein